MLTQVLQLQINIPDLSLNNIQFLTEQICMLRKGMVFMRESGL